jgi:hypothetical protein
LPPSQTPPSSEPDGQEGMGWWNALTDAERVMWAAFVGTGVASDAWERYKRDRARLAQARSAGIDAGKLGGLAVRNPFDVRVDPHLHLAWAGGHRDGVEWK